MHLYEPFGWISLIVALVALWGMARSFKKRQFFPLAFAGITVLVFGFFGVATLIFGGIPG
ncbi:DUF2759 domain-containing protein [Exiguobacterium sp. SH31]|uniref:DUF2759 domain-containing protein n=1 Tax=unclassified Exiguobacterium TaxID=2644629 RepID=UPI000353F82A|nr:MULTISPECIES: DUF2759 domain-containing protein [unclassified Exiguobacterium]EPE60987.1 putative membrane protein [Exiguobacterium sp. S17]OGX80262.1 DUF2759 domain-containing protein [Exiguobacterium sp. SH31]TCI73108.1 DUF2759 domain-containing protein [Exiguobacterium sp. SH0S7]